MKNYFNQKAGKAGYTVNVLSPINQTNNCGTVTYTPYVDNNVYVQSGDLGLLPIVSNVYCKNSLTGGKKKSKHKTKKRKSKKKSKHKTKYAHIKPGQKFKLSNGICARKLSNGRITFIKKSLCKNL